MSRTPKQATDGRHECDNCGLVWPADKLKDIVDIEQRVDVGGPLPSGQCPVCDALCYPIDPKAPRVVVYVSGGNVQCARANVEGIAVEVFDVDNLEETKTGDEIEADWKQVEQEYPHPIF